MEKKSNVLNNTLVNIVNSVEYSYYNAQRDVTRTIARVLIDLCNEQPNAKMLTFDIDSETKVKEFNNGYTAITGVLVQKDDEGDDVLRYELTTCYNDKDDIDIEITNGIFLTTADIIAVWDKVREMYGFNED